MKIVGQKVEVFYCSNDDVVIKNKLKNITDIIMEEFIRENPYEGCDGCYISNIIKLNTTDNRNNDMLLNFLVTVDIYKY